MSHILQFLNLSIAGFVFVDEGVLLQETAHARPRLLQKISDPAAWLRPKLVEQWGEVKHLLGVKLISL